MYLLATRHRPDACRALIDAMTAVGDVPAVAVMVDHGVDEPGRRAAYEAVPWPAHWAVRYADRHLELTEAVNRLVALHPDREFYGLIGDHCRPRTAEWSSALAASAGAWNIAYCRDNWCNGRRLDGSGQVHVSGAIVLGGALVRTLGWFFLPGTVHLYGDDALELIGERLGLMRYRDDVLLETDRYQAGRAPRDDNHRRVFRGRRYHQDDRAAFERWRAVKAEGDILRIGLRMAEARV